MLFDAVLNGLEMFPDLFGDILILQRVHEPCCRALAFFTQFIPNPPLTPDQVRLLGIDNVVSEAAEAEGRTLAGLGVRATAMEIVLPTYLYRFRRGGQFERINAS